MRTSRAKQSKYLFLFVKKSYRMISDSKNPNFSDFNSHPKSCLEPSRAVPVLFSER